MDRVQTGEVIDRLEALAEKFRQKKRLGTGEKDTAKNLLELLFLDPEHTGRACELMTHLPPDICPPAVLGAWRACNGEQRERIVRSLLEERALEGQGGHYRKLSLVGAFIPVDTHIALRLLIDLSDRLTRNGRNRPAPVFIHRFRKELMDTGKLLDIPLGENDIGTDGISGIGTIVLLGMLDGRGPDEDVAWKSDFLKWLGGCRRKATPGANLIAEVEKATKSWPVDLQRQCAELGLINTVVSRIEPIGTGGGDARPVSVEVGIGTEHVSGTAGGSDVSGRATDTAGGESLSPAGSPRMEKAREYLGRLAECITSLERENADLRTRAEEMAAEYRLEKIRTGELEARLAELRTELEHREVLVRDLGERLAVLERQKEDLENVLREEKAAREEEVGRLRERIDRECEYVIREFKNKLLDRLYRYYAGYLETVGMPATDELTAHLRYLLDHVFKELIRQGIGLDMGC